MLKFQRLADWQIVQDGDEQLCLAHEGPFIVWSWEKVSPALIGAPAGPHVIRRK